MEFTYSILSRDQEFIRDVQSMLRNFNDYKLFTAADTNDIMVNHILKDTPSLVFIDLDKKGKVGNPFNMVHSLHPYLDNLPSFVAVSSSKVLAYEVLKNDFLDYLLKPLSELEFRKCLLNYQKRMENRGMERICLKSYSDYQFLHLEEVLYLQADNNTTDFYLTRGRKITAYKTLKFFEKNLPPVFVRVHYSYIINTRQIVRINFGRSLIALRETSSDIPFSRSYKAHVEQLKDKFYPPLSVVS